MPRTHYRIYQSSTTDARIDQPSGPSKMCLSCHDGTLAVGLVANRGMQDPIVMTQRRIGPGSSRLTIDLSDDHPIGFRYDRALFRRDPQLVNPDIVTHRLPRGPRDLVQCTTCHDPHDNTLGNFLREADLYSAICLSCHDLFGWTLGSHARSPAIVLPKVVDPASPPQYRTVAENACANCHKSHSAGSRERLLRYEVEENNCLNCHNGGIARANVATELWKPSAHRSFRFVSLHDPEENPLLMPRHVECVDCHNPHAAAHNPIILPLAFGNPLATAGGVDNTMRFVSGITAIGLPIEVAVMEYEVCFKCHADGFRPFEQPEITRQINQTNTRLQFQPSNPSHHPVIGPRNNRDVVSLIPPMKVGSIIKCTYCHNSDSVTRPGLGTARGPHGSIYEPLLVRNYSTADFTQESPTAYALCYSCHDRASILGDESFPSHNTHIVRARAPCSACHDAHGISRLQGTSRNHSNLMNFDLSIVRPASTGTGRRLEFEDLGRYSGSCTLECHGLTHVRFTYGR
jgi:predicted CXXCH cytochrome family protein